MARTRLGKMKRKQLKEKKKETISEKIAAAKGLQEKKRHSIGNTENIEEIAIRKQTKPKLILSPAAAEKYAVESRPIQEKRLPLIELDTNKNTKKNLENSPKKTEVIPPKSMEP